jgi:16S rRNA processing protein RimM
MQSELRPEPGLEGRIAVVLKQQRFILGEITGAHGVRGEVRVRIASDSPDPLFALESVWIGRGPSDPEARRYAVLECALARAGQVRFRLDGISSREAVAGLVGKLITASPAVLPDLPEDEFYWYQLIGCRVESESGQWLGTVREIWETGAHDVLLVEDEEGVRRLLPTAGPLMKKIDLAAERIVVVDLPGLLEPC